MSSLIPDGFVPGGEARGVRDALATAMTRREDQIAWPSSAREAQIGVVA